MSNRAASQSGQLQSRLGETPSLLAQTRSSMAGNWMKHVHSCPLACSNISCSSRTWSQILPYLPDQSQSRFPYLHHSS